MASGKVHRRVTAIATPLVAIGAGLLSGYLDVGLAAGAGCHAGTYIHPDWDVDHSAPLWRRPYARLIKHRSHWSHWPVLGTLGRLLYIGWPILILLGLLTLTGAAPPNVPVSLTDHRILVALAALGGLMISDILHYIWDLPWPRYARLLWYRRRRRRAVGNRLGPSSAQSRPIRTTTPQNDPPLRPGPRSDPRRPRR